MVKVTTSFWMVDDEGGQNNLDSHDLPDNERSADTPSPNSLVLTRELLVEFWSSKYSNDNEGVGPR
jgi:hypothetical protein